MTSLSTVCGNKINLDTAATTKVKKDVLDSMLPYLTDKWQNPSSLNTESKRISADIFLAKLDIKNFIGANSPNEIYFTSGGSESNCWAIQGFVNYWKARGFNPILITTTIEHKSIMLCAENLCCDVHFIGVNKSGKINTEQLEQLLSMLTLKDFNNKILVSIQYANNELGVVQDIENITRLVHRYSAYLHTDAVQIVGHLPVDVKKLNIDMLSASGHKFGAPKGVGFLYIKEGFNILPLIYGTQNNGMRGGTENVAGIIGMSKALLTCDVSNDRILEIYNKRNTLVNKLLSLNYNFELNNLMSYKDSLPNLLNITIKENITAEGLLHMLDCSNYLISSGSACNSLSNEPSHVLKAIGLSDADMFRTIRISFDNEVDIKDFDKFITELDKALQILQIN